MQIDSAKGMRTDLPASGMHLYHFGTSSCSQKLRIALRMKGAPWTGHVVDLSTHENYGPGFLTLNPRGMVPVLVLDGAVHVESNDILALLEEHFPEPALFPADKRAEIAALLAEEDALHHDLRRLSFRFVHGRSGTTKTPELMRAYRDGSPSDAKKEAEIAFYERLAETGLDEASCRASAVRFRAAFSRFEARLAAHPFLAGAALSVVDIAWFVYAYRLTAGGYPLKELHPRVRDWFEARRAMPGWEAEVALPPAVLERAAAARERDAAAGRTMADLMERT